MLHSDETLVDRALEARKNAYAPYSGYHVGAAILDENDNVHIGSNVENGVHPLGSCAEASAISAMVTNGGKQIKKIAIVGGKDNLSECTPCGGCRQRIAEFADIETQVLLIDANKTIASHRLTKLLPLMFDLNTQ